jgi:plasmid stabilization system protein ParE
VTFRVRFTREGAKDLVRLYEIIPERDPTDWERAERALESIRHAISAVERFPFSYRKATADSPFLRELVIPFDSAGYVALFEIEDDKHVTILAVRHQREDDYY